jgi:hypothetical protein
MGTQPRRTQNGLGQILLADAVINDILKEAIAAARQNGQQQQQQLRAVAKIPRQLQVVSPAVTRLGDVLADDPAPLAVAGGRRR